MEGLEELLAGRRLSPVQRRIALYLSEHLAEAIFLSSVELAERAGVSQPSVTRFAMALGFAGYPELRQALRPLVVGVDPRGASSPGYRPDTTAPSPQGLAPTAADHPGSLGNRGSTSHPGPGAGRPGPAGHLGAAGEPGAPEFPPSAGAPNVPGLPGTAGSGAAAGGVWGAGTGRGSVSGSLLEGALESEIRNLHHMRDRLATLPLAELGETLAAAEPLPVFGLRVSAGLATTFGYYAGLIHPDVRLFTSGGSHLLDGLRNVQRAGARVVLAFVLPRYPAESIQALQYAEKLGLRRIVVTDRPGLPAEVTLDAPVGDRLVFDSHSAPLAMAMALVEAMADAAPLRTQARLEDYERAADEAGIFLPGEPP
ncbi:MurR/RpiR family transcriptional regulator [Nonomuraea sp. NPDC050310]|uniref:MurR/RpiR family transcriptional regulator n=1 Tax=Nonomuraea sp. NPDC050310 TaxID=3154935 RepID=UPI0033E6B07B